MNSRIIFFTFIFSVPLFAMQNETGWNPLTYKTKCVNDSFRELKLNQEKARQFLAQVPASYANMRENVAVDPDHFSRDFFERFKTKMRQAIEPAACGTLKRNYRSSWVAGF